MTSDFFGKLGMAWLVVAALVGRAGGSIYYRDLLRAAVTRNPIPRWSQSISRGRALFRHDSEVCRDAGGRGDGPAAASLPQRPEDLTDIAPPPYFPDGVAAYRIANGGKVMPALKSAPGADDIWDLINLIRSLLRQISRQRAVFALRDSCRTVNLPPPVVTLAEHLPRNLISSSRHEIGKTNA